MASLSNAGLIRWKMANGVARAIQKAGGYVFGGFVRDSIIHDHNAEQFYKVYNKENCDDIYKKYNDTTILPEFKERTIRISDIDCFMTEEQFKKLNDVFNADHYDCIIKNTKTAMFYFGGGVVDVSILKHSKLIVKFQTNDVLQSIVNNFSYYIKVDVIYADTPIDYIYRKLSSNMDFECNSLILSPDNSYNLPIHDCGVVYKPIEKIAKILDIVEDIKNKKAKMISTNMKSILEFRIIKMIEKGFSIYTKNIEVLKMLEDEEEICVICRENIDEEKNHIKDITCNARYCLSCYNQMLSHSEYKHECPNCKQRRYMSSREEHLITALSAMTID
jgi:hypothetical protein